MKKWEYTYALVVPSDDPVKELNQLGEDGWEICAYEPENNVNHGVFYFKREKQEKAHGPYGTQDADEMRRIIEEAKARPTADFLIRLAAVYADHPEARP